MNQHHPPDPILEKRMNPSNPNPPGRRLVLACWAAVAAAALTTTSFASPPSDSAPSVRVRFDDLNLSSARGTSALYHRIQNAARQVCPDYGSRDLVLVAAADHCRSEAVARAVNELHNPQLAMLHASHASGG